MTSTLPPPPSINLRTPIRKKKKIDLLFKNNRIYKHVTNFKTSPPPLPTDVINAWTLVRSIFKKM